MFANLKPNTSKSKPKLASKNSQPLLAWAAILGLILFTLSLIIFGADELLNLTFPIVTLAVGILLYFRYPLIYNSFSWWIWLLAPLVRRLIDYRSSYTEPSPILLAPFLVSSVTIITFFKYLPKINYPGSFPFMVTATGIFYAFLMGLLNKSIVEAGVGLLKWLVPVIFGFYLFVNWRNYPAYRRNLEQTLIWGAMITSIYGIIQFLVAPEWDTTWMIDSNMITSQGDPEPLKLRIWSTLDSGEPFAAFLAAALLLLLVSQNFLKTPAMVVSFLAFLLTTVRSAWGAWLVGLLTLSTSLQGKQKKRLLITIAAIAILLVPLTRIEPFSNPIDERLATFQDIQEDGSALDRQNTYEEQLGVALTTFFGSGIGGVGFDSSFLNLLIQFGWFGTIFYAVGLLLLVYSLFQHFRGSSTPFIVAARAIVISCLIRLPVNVPIIEISGMLLWSFLGMGMAAKKFYRHHSPSRPARSK